MSGKAEPPWTLQSSCRENRYNAASPGDCYNWAAETHWSNRWAGLVVRPNIFPQKRMELVVPNRMLTERNGGESRRNFLAKLGLGFAALAGVSAGIVRVGGRSSTTTDEFPGPDSIFHPAQDPRQDPRRQS